MEAKEFDWEKINKATGTDIITILMDFLHARVDAGDTADLIAKRCESSFNAGQDSITKLHQDEIEEFYNEGRLAGIREVVEWIENNKLFALVPSPKEFVIGWSDWQAKLKDWGISDKERVSHTSTE